jgi:hypothetical protein
LQYGKSVRDRYQPLSTKLPCGGSPWGIAWWGKAASRLVKPVKSSYFRPIIEEPRSKLRGIFDRKELGLFFVSLANPAASGGECTRCCGSIHNNKKKRAEALFFVFRLVVIMLLART